MNSKLYDFIKGVFLTSVASLYSIDGHAVKNPALNENASDAQINQGTTKSTLSKKLLLKINNDNSYLLAGHRSHRSHSSHYSSRSGSSSSGSSSSSSSRSSGSSSSSRSSSTTTTGSSAQTINKVYKLGDRILKKGMKGHDVTELRNILVKKNFIKLKEGEEKILTGELLFDEIIENAVKEFQKDHKLTADGIVGTSTVYYLKKEDANNSTK